MPPEYDLYLLAAQPVTRVSAQRRAGESICGTNTERYLYACGYRCGLELGMDTDPGIWVQADMDLNIEMERDINSTMDMECG